MTDALRRHAILAENWTEGATYLDPVMQAKGHDEIGAIIGAVHQRFPGFRFHLDGKVDGYADQLRFSWALSPDGGEGVIKGTDFVVLHAAAPVDHGGVVVPLELATEAGLLSFFSTTTVFGAPRDITLDKLAIEAFFPANAETAEALRRLAASDPK
jgi:hypothetical protein